MTVNDCVNDSVDNDFNYVKESTSFMRTGSVLHFTFSKNN